MRKLIVSLLATVALAGSTRAADVRFFHINPLTHSILVVNTDKSSTVYQVTDDAKWQSLTNAIAEATVTMPNPTSTPATAKLIMQTSPQP